MKLSKLICAALLLSLTAACAQQTTLTSADPEADATITVREAQVMRLATGGSAKGTLTYKGWEYEFEVTNMALSAVQSDDIQFEGNVFNLNQVNDFEGRYKAVAADVAGGKGAQGFWFENEKGVRVHMIVEGQEVTIRLDTEGSIVTLK